MNPNLFWGKSSKDGLWHPAVCHMIDVGQAATRLLAEAFPGGLAQGLAYALGVGEERATQWIGFLCALHDLGKVSPGFQKKCPDLFEGMKTIGFAVSDIDEQDHSCVTAQVLPDLLVHRGVPSNLAEDMAAAVGGHHGSFHASDGYSPGGGLWEEAREVVFDALGQVFEVDSEGMRPSGDRLPAGWLMVLAGLTSVSDWVGSDTRFFPFAVPAPDDLAAYAQDVRVRAERAVASIGWGSPVHDVEARSFGELFFAGESRGTGRLPWSPNPMQEACGRLVAETGSPFLLLVEAPMGTGKTEAALWAADICGSRRSHPGLYYALPTQATSNQMLDRLLAFLGNRYSADVVQLHLLHGMADLNETFQELRRKAADDDREAVDPENISDAAGEKATGTVLAREWFCGRKRGLLSPFAVGTIDQALLGALTTRHFFVRLFGLAQKTVIIDEVHAYDTYMSTLLDRLLKWLAAMGSSVILLSATLPAVRRLALIRAFAGEDRGEGLGTYPRVVVASGTHLVSASLPVAAAETRELAIAGCSPGIDGAIGLLADRLVDGGCAAWVCNTVRGAQEAYQALSGDSRLADAERVLLHARFPVEDRLERERQVLAKFGKSGARPRKAVVVATQVIEQSLDLDFDFLVTDLAPIDLVLQRAGRLHRHAGRTRPSALSRPEVRWRQPKVGDNGVPVFGSSAHVYDPFVLLRTWLLLRDRSTIVIPSEMEACIEAVYGPDAPPPQDASLRDALATLRQESDAERRHDESSARKFILPPPDRSGGVLDAIEFSPPDDETAQKMTRLADPTVTVVCVHETPSGLSLTPDGAEPVSLEFKPDRSLVMRLMQRSVHIGTWFWYRHFVERPCPPGWREIPLLRSCRLACFRDGEIRVEGRTLRLDPNLGLLEVTTTDH